MSIKSEWLGPAFQAPARRVVSLVPSLTEALFMLGAGDRVAGRTVYCYKPKGQVERIPTVGGTKNSNVDEIRALSPDLILANREENMKICIMQLAEDFPVLLTDPQSPEDVPALWMELGSVTGLDGKARALADETLSTLAGIRMEQLFTEEKPTRFLYFIWKKPWMAAGHGTYISNMLSAVGFENALPPELTRFPKLSEEQILSFETDLYFYSTEPYPFKLPDDILLPDGVRCVESAPDSFRVHENRLALLVDAEPLSWYPSQTPEGLRYAAELIRRWKRGKRE